MTISTTTKGFRWPNNDEPVTNGWDAIRDLAVDVDGYLDLGHLTAQDPIVRQSTTLLAGPGSLWTLGDFGVATAGASGDTGGWFRTREGIVDGWASAVQNGNGPSFGGPAANTWVKLPVAAGELPHRMPVGSWSYWSFDRSAPPGLAGEILLDKGFFIAGEHWGLLSTRLASNNQFSLNVRWSYPIDLP